MKIKDGYVINEIAGMKMAIYIGDADDGLKGIVKLNALGAFLWEKLIDGCAMDELVKAVTDKYDVDKKIAAKDVKAFVDILRANSIIEE